MSTGTFVAYPLPKIACSELAQIPAPRATSTYKPVPHPIVEALSETLSFRQIGVLNEERAVFSTFGVVDLEARMEGCFSIGRLASVTRTAGPCALD